MKFEKYHGLGNDFIILSSEDVGEKSHSELALKMCHNHFGIGADGLMVHEEINGRAKMNFYNKDGSTATMCGNGIRCFSHYLYNRGLFKEKKVEIETGAGILTVERVEGEEFLVKVAMGQPIFNGREIPLSIDIEEFVDEKIEFFGKEIRISALFMGTTHSVVFVNKLDSIDVEDFGKRIETLDLFPKKTNVNFCEVIDKDELDVATWERGAGETLACGTGACASVVIGQKLGLLSSEVAVNVPGGRLNIKLGDEVYMTGPSVKIAEGLYNLGGN